MPYLIYRASGLAAPSGDLRIGLLKKEGDHATG
jgi:hypothetical protein